MNNPLFGPKLATPNSEAKKREEALGKTKIYLQNKERHLLEGGTVVNEGGGDSFEWRNSEGELHCDFRPALVSRETEEYWLNGKKLSLEDWQRQTKRGIIKK